MKKIFTILFISSLFGGAACGGNPFPVDPKAYTLTYDSVGNHLFVEFTAEKVPQAEDQNISVKYEDIKDIVDVWGESVSDKGTKFHTACNFISEKDRTVKCIVDFPKDALPKCDPYTLVVSAQQKLLTEDKQKKEFGESSNVVSTPEFDVTTATPAQGETLTCLTITSGTDGDRDGDKISDSKDLCPDKEEIIILGSLEPADGVRDGCPNSNGTEEDLTSDESVSCSGADCEKSLSILKASGSGCALVEAGGSVSLWPLVPLFFAMGFRRRLRGEQS